MRGKLPTGQLKLEPLLSSIATDHLRNLNSITFRIENHNLPNYTNLQPEYQAPRQKGSNNSKSHTRLITILRLRQQKLYKTWMLQNRNKNLALHLITDAENLHICECAVRVLFFKLDIEQFFQIGTKRTVEMRWLRFNFVWRQSGRYIYNDTDGIKHLAESKLCLRWSDAIAHPTRAKLRWWKRENIGEEEFFLFLTW